jgi:hypothetical protein
MKFSNKALATLTLGFIFAGGADRSASAQEIRTGDALIRAMHDQYQNNWYRTLTFTQKSTTYNPGGSTQSEIWHEAALLPGKLRIDMGPLTDGNGALFTDGTLTLFKDGKATRSAPFVHMLMVLGFDVYAQDAENTIRQAKDQGFNLSKFREDAWEGAPVYVVGADAGDSKSKQFWIEKKRLLLLRLIEPGRQDPARTTDTRFLDYRKLSTGWVAAQVAVYVEGKRIFGEEYSEIETDPTLDPAVFDPKQFITRHWEK